MKFAEFCKFMSVIKRLVSNVRSELSHLSLNNREKLSKYFGQGCFSHFRVFQEPPPRNGIYSKKERENVKLNS